MRARVTARSWPRSETGEQYSRLWHSRRKASTTVDHHNHDSQHHHHLSNCTKTPQLPLSASWPPPPRRPACKIHKKTERQASITQKKNLGQDEHVAHISDFDSALLLAIPTCSKSQHQVHQKGKTNLSHDGPNRAHIRHWRVNNPAHWDFCVSMTGRAHIE